MKLVCFLSFYHCPKPHLSHFLYFENKLYLFHTWSPRQYPIFVRQAFRETGNRWYTLYDSMVWFSHTPYHFHTQLHFHQWSTHERTRDNSSMNSLILAIG